MELECMTPATQVRDYLALPRFLLGLDLNATETLVYVLLLDRLRLSQRDSRWQDEQGRVYCLYPVSELAEALGKSRTVIKQALAALEKRGLLLRRRTGGNAPNHISLYLPPNGRKTALLTAGKPAIPEVGKPSPSKIINNKTTGKSTEQYAPSSFKHYDCGEDVSL